MRRVAAAAALAGLPTEAPAHAFQSEPSAQFVEGIAVCYTDPRIVLALVATGLFISLRDPQGLPRVWAWVLGGFALGLLLAPLVPPEFAAVTLSAAAIVSVLAALAPPWPMRVVAVISAVTAVTVTALALEGHDFATLPAFAAAGILLGANLSLAVPAGLASFALMRFRPGPTRIALRILASWCGAISVMLLAFTLR